MLTNEAIRKKNTAYQKKLSGDHIPFSKKECKKFFRVSKFPKESLIFTFWMNNNINNGKKEDKYKNVFVILTNIPFFIPNHLTILVCLPQFFPEEV